LSRARISARRLTGSGRLFTSIIRNVENDLGGKRDLSEVQTQLIRAFAGTTTLLQAQNFELLISGRTDEVDLSGYAALVGCLTRLAHRLGLQRRQRDLTPTLDAYLEARRREERNNGPQEDNDDGANG
jgi:hypothetical protein